MEAAQADRAAFGRGEWDKRYTSMSDTRPARRRPSFLYSRAICKINYTANAIDTINAELREIIRTRGRFPSGGAATKLLWLALCNVTGKWGSSAHGWKATMN